MQNLGEIKEDEVSVEIGNIQTKAKQQQDNIVPNKGSNNQQ